MKYILDSSVGVKWVVTENYSDKADTLRQDPQRHSPTSGSRHLPYRSRTRFDPCREQGRVPVGKAQDLLGDVLTTPPQLHPFYPLLIRPVEISSQLRIGVYDCVYVALAEREHSEFVTADDRLVNNVQKSFPFVIHLATLP